MLNLITVDRPLTVNGNIYTNAEQAYKALKGTKGVITATLNTTTQNKDATENKQDKDTKVDKYKETFRIHVKKWMTEKSSPTFDFMKKWNNDIPMPLVIMKGNIVDETKGMYKMRLHATPEPSTHCFKCGRKLTHAVSVLYGIGPECGEHFHINPLDSKEDLDREMDKIKQRMSEMKWEGWIIKSAIKDMEVVDAD